MKILHVIDSGGFYGAEAVLVELSLEQMKAGHKVTVCSIGEPSEAEKPLEKVCRERGVNVYALRIKAGLNILGGMNVVRYAKENEFDLYHSHGYKGNILLGVLPKTIRKLPLVTTLHGWTATKKVSKIWLYEFLDSMLLARMDGIVLVSHAMQSRKGIANRNFRLCRVIPNGIGEGNPRFSSKDVVADTIIKMKKRGPVIGSIGRLSFEKGYDILIKAFAQIKQQVKDAKLVILGDGKLITELKELTARYGVESDVWFAGYVKDANKYIELFDVYVNSSRTEGTPITLLEAMRAETPIVAARVGGNSLLIEDGACGICFDITDDNSLNDSVIDALLNRELANQLVNNAKIKFNEHYSSKIMMKRYEQLYSELI